jgi:hypothetical protein
MKTRNVNPLLLLATSLLVACGTAPVSSASTPSPTVTQPSSPTPGPTLEPTPSIPGTTLYTFAPEPGSAVMGTVQVATAGGRVTLTARLSGLRPGRSYIVDADPLPCMLFVGGPSQAFPKALKADSSGTARVVWTVPNGMAGNVSLQSLTSRGTFVVLACADLV